ncbi:MAG TPA: hypothetical protein PLL30_15550 [Candidatus Krumholzibacteria bacterium]|nr:hypothetical protein [Candidatus Krumholzibacteria bacterium]HPD73186.1 hypothetical protein [Candidatus Krumholzibacteria bacterium]HRY41936.1 hypothetical protein [Candidatus Krumholzibacteria bacterium]
MTARLDSRTVILAGVFWGSAWGLYEATVGWLVHNVVRFAGASGVLLVPFAVFCLYRALRAGGSYRSVGLAAATAASLKLADFLLPAPRLHTVFNPAVAILLEGLAFALVARRLADHRRRTSLAAVAIGAVAFNTVWRVLFLVYSAGIAAGWSIGLMLDGLHTPAGFLVRDSLASSAVIAGGAVLVHRVPDLAGVVRPQPGPLATGSIFALALLVELAMGLLG